MILAEGRGPEQVSEMFMSRLRNKSRQVLLNKVCGGSRAQGEQPCPSQHGSERPGVKM